MRIFSINYDKSKFYPTSTSTLCIYYNLNMGLRKYLLNNTGNLIIINSKDKIFEDASIDNCIVFFERDNPKNVTFLELNVLIYSIYGGQILRLLIAQIVLQIQGLASFVHCLLFI